VMARSSGWWTRASMPVLAVTGEFSWGPEGLVIPEHAVGVEDGRLRLSDEETEYGWFGLDDACKAVRWDSHRTAL
jgi:dihydroneopterin triphosphate diphosphatase